MGHREDLLAGAKRCLYEKGYARTTTRDIVAASGANLASIGYHYGSKEALLIAAVIQATREWGDELERVLASEHDPDAAPMQRFETTWTRVVELFGAHRQLWAAQFGILAQIEHEPRLRQLIAESTQEARLGLAALFQGLDPIDDEQKAMEVGSYYYALLIGVLAQHLIDPGSAPSGRDLANALHTITTGAEL
ncbi:MAG: TetR/AcrR family transcriptional regulator [Sphaerisporangium sp.]|jgi:AcrR family transcriptional regulator|nr:TetR/AcrR family transcriptional regulator [Sphaerisporangium sp.]